MNGRALMRMLLISKGDADANKNALLHSVLRYGEFDNVVLPDDLFRELFDRIRILDHMYGYVERSVDTISENNKLMVRGGIAVPYLKEAFAWTQIEQLLSAGKAVLYVRWMDDVRFD